MKNIITVTVIIPNYNYSIYLEKCINSVLESDFNLDNIEIIIIDDASVDNSVEIVNKIVLKTKISITLIQNDTNIGLIRNRNRGIKNANGEYLFFLDSDNYITKDCIRKHFEILSFQSNISACYAPIIDINEETGELAQNRSNYIYNYEELLKGNYIDAMAMYRKKDLIEIGMYDTNMPPYGWEDYELWLRFGKNNKNIYFINGAPLSYYRVHSKSMLSSLTNENYYFLNLYLKNKYNIKIDFKYENENNIIVLNQNIIEIETQLKNQSTIIDEQNKTIANFEINYLKLFNTLQIKDEEINKKDNEIINKDEIINIILSSKSWKLTKPLRDIIKFFR